MQTDDRATPWLVRYRASPRTRLRLFCFPYAGGAAQVFRLWPQSLPDFIEVCAVQPPGRGSRLREEPFTRLDALVEAAMPALIPFMDVTFAFYGHSMGAMIAFEAARRLRCMGVDGPAHLFVGACRAPRLASEREITYDLPEPEFIEELRRRGGTPTEVLGHEELLHLLLPLLRADFAVIETYSYAEGPPLDCPLTAFGGLEDEGGARESLAPWEEHTAGQFSLHMLPGDHFFLRSSQPLLESIARTLRGVAAGLS
ncbi:MAG: putative thioesterase [Acidobacteria bacterium]|nr:MAG: putative thioesterase [Acidobacteriota bacterium]